MTQKISDVTNGAKLVRWYDDYDFAVWLGGHTVNFYRMSVNGDTDVFPLHSISVGDFSSGQITRKDVKNQIEKQFEFMD